MVEISKSYKTWTHNLIWIKLMDKNNIDLTIKK